MGLKIFIYKFQRFYYAIDYKDLLTCTVLITLRNKLLSVESIVWWQNQHIIIYPIFLYILTLKCADVFTIWVWSDNIRICILIWVTTTMALTGWLLYIQFHQEKTSQIH